MCNFFGLTKYLDSMSLQTTTYWECISIKLSNSFKYFLRYHKTCNFVILSNSRFKVMHLKLFKIHV